MRKEVFWVGKVFRRCRGRSCSLPTTLWAPNIHESICPAFVPESQRDSRKKRPSRSYFAFPTLWTMKRRETTRGYRPPATGFVYNVAAISRGLQPVGCVRSRVFPRYRSYLPLAHRLIRGVSWTKKSFLPFYQRRSNEPPAVNCRRR